ncbi:MAG: hypothetical protein ACJA16_005048 [Akkermansiaceae bacterium]
MRDEGIQDLSGNPLTINPSTLKTHQRRYQLLHGLSWKGRNFPKSDGQDIKTAVIPFTSISNDSFLEWLEAGRQLEPKYGYPSVILLPDDTVVKIWAKKPGFFSSGRWSPYSSRFVKHALALKSLGFSVPELLTHGSLAETQVRIVHYRSLPGESVRSILHRDAFLN